MSGGSARGRGVNHLLPRTWRLTPQALPTGHPATACWPWLLPGTADALAWLRGHGLTRGQRLGIVAGNTPAVAALLLAAPLAGATTVLLNRRLPDAELADQARRARVALLVCDLRAVPTAAGLAGALPLPESFADDSLPDAAPCSPLRDDDPALVLFTSGTSGRPKAARLSWRALRHAADAAVSTLGLGAQTPWLACLPLDHIGGASIVFRAARSGQPVLLVERFGSEVVNSTIDAGAVSGASLVPTMLHRLLAERAGRPWPATLRCLLTGGGPLSPELITACTALGLAPSQTYGLTEAASQVCTLLPTDAAAHPGSAGRPLPGTDLRIDADTDGVGLILIRGPGLFSGYEENGVLSEPLAAGAWFTTGDLGSVNDGYLTVHGRRNDLIISGGENVYPAEIEAALERHPAVAEAGVHGSADAEWGQVVAAVLIARGTPPNDGDFAAWCAANLGGHQRPRRWRWVRALPRTATGKLQRQLLAQWSDDQRQS